MAIKTNEMKITPEARSFGRDFRAAFQSFACSEILISNITRRLKCASTGTHNCSSSFPPPLFPPPLHLSHTCTPVVGREITCHRTCSSAHVPTIYNILTSSHRPFSIALRSIYFSCVCRTAHVCRPVEYTHSWNIRYMRGMRHERKISVGHSSGVRAPSAIQKT